MFTHSWQTPLERIDSDAVLWSSIFSDIAIWDKKKQNSTQKVILSTFFS